MKSAEELYRGHYANFGANYMVCEAEFAEDFQEICKKNILLLSDKDAYETITSIIRWAKQLNVSIHQLKSTYLNDFDRNYDGTPLETIIEELKTEKIKEAESFHISPDNTISNLKIELLSEWMSEKVLEKVIIQSSWTAGVPDKRIPAIIESVKKHREESNVAPDISKLDRVENRLFELAKKGVAMLHQGLPLPPNGRVEALVLCSTCVIDLPTNFTNDIDMDVQTDRYFLLLADSIMLEEVEEPIDFINSRVEFYTQARADCSKLDLSDAYSPNSPICQIYNALYLNPLCESPRELSVASEKIEEVKQFSECFNKVQEMMEEEKQTLIQ